MNPLRNSSSSPFVLKQFEDASNEPYIETPLSPDQEELPPYDYQDATGKISNNKGLLN